MKGYIHTHSENQKYQRISRHGREVWLHPQREDEILPIQNRVFEKYLMTWKGTHVRDAKKTSQDKKIYEVGIK